MLSMKSTIEVLRAAGIRDQVKVLVGGAPITEKFARKSARTPTGTMPSARWRWPTKPDRSLERLERDTRRRFDSRVHVLLETLSSEAEPQTGARRNVTFRPPQPGLDESLGKWPAGVWPAKVEAA